MIEKYEFTKKIVLEAGELIKQMMAENVTVEIKSHDADFVTNVDKEIERFLVSKINNKYSNQSYLTEEEVVDTTQGNNLWIIDPIDGTMNFVKRRREFAISVAYIENNKPIFGFVYDVMNRELFHGMIGHAAYLNELELKKLDQTTDLSNSLVYGNLSLPNLLKVSIEEFMSKILVHRYIAAGAIEICQIAAGRGQAYWYTKLNVWDFAAAVIILHCVGGVWVFDDKKLNVPTKPQTAKMIACSNELILNEILEYLN